MIVWRNSGREITDMDIRRIVRQQARDRGLDYRSHDRLLQEDRMVFIVYCNLGRTFRFEVLCEYRFDEQEKPMNPWSEKIQEILDAYGIQLLANDPDEDNPRTKGEVAEEVIQRKFVFDFALPQLTVDEFGHRYGIDIRPCFVYAYPPQASHGILFPLTQSAFLEVGEAMN